MKTIPLTRGLFALVDDVDYERVREHSWHAKRARSTIYGQAMVNGRMTSLHRFILANDDAAKIDHISRNGLDCRRANLRGASTAQNAANAKLSSRNTSGFKGVSRRIDSNRWQAIISTSNARKHLGLFLTAEEAARAYDAAARDVFGKFARVNFPLPGEQGCREVA